MARINFVRFGFVVVSACMLTGASSALAGPKEDVQAAAQKLADAPNYSWTANTTGGFGGGTTEGKTQKDGATWLSLPTRDATVTAVIQGDKAVAQTDNGWQDLSDLQQAQGPTRFLGAMLRNFVKPADQAKQLATDADALQKEDDAVGADLPEATAKKLLSMRRGRNADNGNGPQASNAKAHVKFWLGDDGMLKKMELHVTGTVTFNGNDRDVDRTTTTEIKDVGSTKVEIPADAKAKLEGTASTPPTTQPQ